MYDTTRLRMSERERQQIYQAVLMALHILNQRWVATAEQRYQIFLNFEKYAGRYSCTYGMDFMKVSRRLNSGYVQNLNDKQYKRRWQIFLESEKIAKESGAAFEEVKELFCSMMEKYIKT